MLKSRQSYVFEILSDLLIEHEFSDGFDTVGSSALSGSSNVSALAHYGDNLGVKSSWL